MLFHCSQSRHRLRIDDGIKFLYFSSGPFPVGHVVGHVVVMLNCCAWESCVVCTDSILHASSQITCNHLAYIGAKVETFLGVLIESIGLLGRLF